MNREIFKTYDYSIFKFVKENRKIDDKHVSKIASSIGKKDLTQDFPIIVNKDMEIIDGQHTFQACKLRGLPIYYIFAVFADRNDISNINTVKKKWTMEDFLHQYIQEGDINYIKFKEFIDKSKCKTISKAIRLLTTSKRYSHTGGSSLNINIIHKFKIGAFEYPEDDSYINRKIYELNQISEYTHNKDPYSNALLCAYDIMISHDFYDFDRLIRKLNQKKLNVFSDAKSCIDAINDIYNHKQSESSMKTFYMLRGKQNGAN